MHGILARGFLSVRQADSILIDMQDVPVEDRLGRELCFLQVLAGEIPDAKTQIAALRVWGMRQKGLLG